MATAEFRAPDQPDLLVPTVDAGDAGYSKGLKPRHVSMIAIGGAIGTGLFLGTGANLGKAGPSLALCYTLCGVFAFFVVRGLGEMVLRRPATDPAAAMAGRRSLRHAGNQDLHPQGKPLTKE
ncbi:MAG TPA: hypothetical protein VGX23_32950 [Actinocrinis sp.]|nr:hypothetical protein [Actinocrinis sp.]